MRTTLTLLAALPLALMAQTNYDIEVGGSMLQPQNLPYYDPQFLTIDVGDCLLYTSDAADERSSVDLGGRRIIKKKNKSDNCNTHRLK